MPKGYTGEYLIFALSQGDIARRTEVAERYTLSDAQKWMALRSYDNVVQEELHKIALAKAKRG